MNYIARTLLNVIRIEVLLGIGLVAWVFSLEARAEYMTGGFLAGLCASGSEDTADAGKAWESGGCVGYIVGVADALDHQHKPLAAWMAVSTAYLVRRRETRS